METFITAYTIVWSAILLYVVRLGLRQRRFARRLATFERDSFRNREQLAKAA